MLIDSAALRKVIQNRLDQARILREEATNFRTDCRAAGLVEAYDAVLLDIKEHERAASVGLEAVRRELEKLTDRSAA